MKNLYFGTNEKFYNLLYSNLLYLVVRKTGGVKCQSFT